jgi:hypothetical protein
MGHGFTASTFTISVERRRIDDGGSGLMKKRQNATRYTIPRGGEGGSDNGKTVCAVVGRVDAAADWQQMHRRIGTVPADPEGSSILCVAGGTCVVQHRSLPLARELRTAVADHASGAAAAVTLLCLSCQVLAS